jgi:hypothetical protein
MWDAKDGRSPASPAAPPAPGANFAISQQVGKFCAPQELRARDARDRQELGTSWAVFGQKTKNPAKTIQDRSRIDCPVKRQNHT